MRKLLLAAIAALLAAGSVGAIINGQPDGNGHPYVVAIGFFDQAGDEGAFCTGTLVSPTLVVTAGHCTHQSPGAVIWTSSQALAGPPDSFGIPITHPDFDPELNTPNTGDLGVVRLLRPVHMDTYGALPTAGYLDGKDVKKERTITVVGYGFQSVEPAVFTGERMVATTRFKNVSASVVQGYGVKSSGANNGGKSGTCLGDSGGPMLHGGTNLILSVNSFGQKENCTGSDFSFRLDTPGARAFLGQFVPLP